MNGMNKMNGMDGFPTFELCYEISIHKKVYNADVVMAIPEGQPSMLWFHAGRCWLLHLTENGNGYGNGTKQTFELDVRFSAELGAHHGTVLYGTHFDQCFCVEDVYFYKGQTCRHHNFEHKLKLLRHMLGQELNQNQNQNQSIHIGLPLLHASMDVVLKDMLSLPYRVRSLKCRFFAVKHKILTVDLKLTPAWSLSPTQTHTQTTQTQTQSNSCINRCINSMTAPLEPKTGPLKTEPKQHYNKQHPHPNHHHHPHQKTKPKQEAVFKVMADLAFDVYHLYDSDNRHVGAACITNYKMSVMMNRLFRRIKENHSLDAIEESDDEDDFEDVRPDKFVDLNKELFMLCEYHPTFDKWMPKHVV